MNFKKIMAGALCATMVLGSTVAVFAAEGTTQNVTGTTKVEGYVDTTILSAVLPTIAPADVEFTLDPQHLLKETANDADRSTNTLTVTDTTGMVFLTDANTYANTSKEFTVENKSSVDVDITVDVEVTNYTGVAIATTNSFADVTGPAMYLSLSGAVDSGDATVTYLGEDGTLSQTAKVLDDKDDYKFEYADDGTYSYSNSLTGHVNSKYVFTLSGGVDCDADWEEVKDVTPGIKLTWTIVKHVEGPQVSATTAGVITVTGLTAAKNATGVITTQGSVKTDLNTVVSGDLTWNTDNWSEEAGGTLVITLRDTYPTYYTGETVTIGVELSDGSVITTTVVFP